MTHSSESISRELHTLFLSASAAVTRRLHGLNVPLIIPRQQTIVKRNEDGNGWQSSVRQVEKNTLAYTDSVIALRLSPLLPPDVVAMAHECAEHITGTTGVHLPFFGPIRGTGWMLTTGLGAPFTPPPSYESDPGEWAATHLLLPALYKHLQDLRQLDLADNVAASAFASDVINFARADRLTYQVTIPLAGLRLPSSRKNGIANNDASLVPLSEEQQGDLLEKWGIGGPNPFLDLPSVALTLTTYTRRTEQNPDTKELVSRWLCAFYLHGYELAGSTAETSMFPRWASPATSTTPLRLREQVQHSTVLIIAGFRKICMTVNKLVKHCIGEPRSERDFALHKFSSGFSRQNSADAVVDFVVALESLLLPYDKATRHGDLGYRFRMHGAHYLVKGGKRLDIAKQLTDLYDLRSRLVHGGKYPSPTDIEAGRRTAGELARRGLLKAVTEGFPTAEQFKMMLLSGR